MKKCYVYIKLRKLNRKRDREITETIQHSEFCTQKAQRASTSVKIREGGRGVKGVKVTDY